MTDEQKLIPGVVVATMTPAKWDMAAFRAKFQEMALRQAAQREAELVADQAARRDHSKLMEE